MKDFTPSAGRYDAPTWGSDTEEAGALKLHADDSSPASIETPWGDVDPARKGRNVEAQAARLGAMDSADERRTSDPSTKT